MNRLMDGIARTEGKRPTFKSAPFIRAMRRIKGGDGVNGITTDTWREHDRFVGCKAPELVSENLRAFRTYHEQARPEKGNMVPLVQLSHDCSRLGLARFTQVTDEMP